MENSIAYWRDKAIEAEACLAEVEAENKQLRKRIRELTGRKEGSFAVDDDPVIEWHELGGDVSHPSGKTSKIDDIIARSWRQRMSEQTPSTTYLRRAHKAEDEVDALRARLAEVEAENKSLAGALWSYRDAWNRGDHVAVGLARGLLFDLLREASGA